MTDRPGERILRLEREEARAKAERYDYLTANNDAELWQHERELLALRTSLEEAETVRDEWWRLAAKNAKAAEEARQELAEFKRVYVQAEEEIERNAEAADERIEALEADLAEARQEREGLVRRNLEKSAYITQQAARIRELEAALRELPKGTEVAPLPSGPGGENTMSEAKFKIPSVARLERELEEARRGWKAENEMHERHHADLAEARQERDRLTEQIRKWADTVDEQAGRTTMTMQMHGFSPVRFMEEVRTFARAALQPTPATEEP